MVQLIWRTQSYEDHHNNNFFWFTVQLNAFKVTP